jgi:peptidoglycan-N-acetylglucosamine deacetylase
MSVWVWSAGVAATAVAAGVGSWGAVSPSSQLFGKSLRHTGKPDDIALTFDDGPNPKITPRLLDLLDRHHVKATFFLIGRYVRACRALTAEIAARGHAIGNHTETHPNLLWMGRASIEDELQKCREAIESATGHPPVWMRPPFGFRGPQLQAALRNTGHREMVMWSALAWDWKPQPATKVIERLRAVRGGDIVLLHDGDHREPHGNRGHTVDALGYWLPRWNDEGLRFVTVDDCGGGA